MDYSADSAMKNVMKSRPRYMDTSETRVVDLSPDGIEAIPVLGRHNYKHGGGGTVAHVHPGMIEMIYCRRGANLTFDYGGEIVEFNPGSVFVAQPETPHFLRRYPKSLSTIWIWFRLPKDGEATLGLSRDETEWLVSRLRAMPTHFEATDALKRSFRKLWTIYETEHQGAIERHLRLRHAAIRLLLDMIESSSTQKADVSYGRIETLVDEIRQNPSRDYNLDELANRAAMSVAKLTACFRRRTGLPPHAFMLFCRMSAAKELLATTRKSVSAIAHSLGFPSAQHFATLFRRETGKTPQEWRRK